MVKKKRARHVAKKRVVKKKEQESVYVKLHNALDLRKEILETAIESTALLRRLENYKMLRKMRLEETKELKKIMDDIEKEFRVFKKHLPKIEIEEPIHEEEPKEQPPEPEEKPKEESELSTIDSEIAELKARLSQLNI